jgi:hypothetical protein
MCIKLACSWSTLNSWSGHPKRNSPMSLSMSMNVTRPTKMVRKPRESERDLYVEGSFGKASNWASGAGTAASSFSRILGSPSKDMVESRRDSEYVSERHVDPEKLGLTRGVPGTLAASKYFYSPRLSEATEEDNNRQRRRVKVRKLLCRQDQTTACVHFG